MINYNLFSLTKATYKAPRRMCVLRSSGAIIHTALPVASFSLKFHQTPLVLAPLAYLAPPPPLFVFLPLLQRRTLMPPEMDYSSSCKYLFWEDDVSDSSSPQLPLMPRKPGRRSKSPNLVTALLCSVFPTIQSLLLPSSCYWLSAPAPAAKMATRKKVTGTFFGNKKGRVSFAVQGDSRSEPLLLIELAMATSQLVKEMASGMVRILLECERSAVEKRRTLWEEPVWTVYCNGHRRGFAVSRPCGAEEARVLGAVRAVSVGAGVLPGAAVLPAVAGERGGGGGEMMYMRAKFERVVGSRDSEALYMISPEGRRTGKYDHGGPELSVFLLRI